VQYTDNDFIEWGRSIVTLVTTFRFFRYLRRPYLAPAVLVIPICRYTDIPSPRSYVSLYHNHNPHRFLRCSWIPDSTTLAFSSIGGILLSLSSVTIVITAYRSPLKPCGCLSNLSVPRDVRGSIDVSIAPDDNASRGGDSLSRACMMRLHEYISVACPVQPIPNCTLAAGGGGFTGAAARGGDSEGGGSLGCMKFGSGSGFWGCRVVSGPCGERSQNGEWVFLLMRGRIFACSCYESLQLRV